MKSLLEHGYKDIVRWIKENYANILDFSLCVGLSDKVSSTCGWTDDMMLRELTNIYCTINRIVVPKDIKNYNITLYNWIRKTYKDGRFFDFMSRYNIDFLNLSFDEQELTRRYTPKRKYRYDETPQEELYWSNERVLHEIRKWWAFGYPLNVSAIQRYNNSLYHKAHKPYRFGSWRNACIAAGFDYDKDIMVQKHRGKQYYVDYLKILYAKNGHIRWSDIKNMNGAMRYFDSYYDWFRAAGVSSSQLPGHITKWSKFGQRFERIVKDIFDILYPLFIYQFNGFEDIRPDWYDAETRTIYDAKLTMSASQTWEKVDAYIDSCDKLVVIYLTGNPSESSESGIKYVHVSKYVQRLPDNIRTHINKLLDALYEDMNNAYMDEDAMETWIQHNGDIPDGYYVVHSDNNAQNNDISNLRLVDRTTWNMYQHRCFINESGVWVKKCTRCGEIKPIHDYYNLNKNGSWCKQCISERSVELAKQKSVIKRIGKIIRVAGIMYRIIDANHNRCIIKQVDTQQTQTVTYDWFRKRRIKWNITPVQNVVNNDIV